MLTADIYNYIYIKTEIDTLFPNIDLSNYYIKTEIDTLLPNRFKQLLYYIRSR